LRRVLLARHYPWDRFEVLLAKNFRDRGLESSLERLSIRCIFSNEDSLGAKISNSLPVIKGGVVSFLSDDVLFAPRKLECAANVFEGGAHYT
jgi:hypothetical protein